ncbi:YebC/PmpR family DNA-binding transcriptional regulator [Candidatus Wolfebacteria bacterium]|nr:YebC/PmpR family DNA-binding transcriptional regulator [Candidatus Wolfebacteria bacterium]
MSGHSKWSKVKHKKAVTDAKKSREFSKLVRLIKAEARQTGGDINSPKLKAVVEKAKAVNMPKDNIERAVRSATDTSGESYDAATYEAYGPGGAAMIIEILTDNRNRAAAEIKHIFSKRGLAIASPGAASWVFSKDERGEWRPKQTLTLNNPDRTSLNELIEELENNDDVQNVFTNAA